MQAQSLSFNQTDNTMMPPNMDWKIMPESEPHDLGEFVGFLILSVVTFGLYAAYDFWKRKRIDTNLFRPINAKYK